MRPIVVPAACQSTERYICGNQAIRMKIAQINSAQYTVCMYSHQKPPIPVPASHVPMLVQFLENQVNAGFPSPADDLGAERIDLAALLGTDRPDSFFMRVSGHSMVELGIFDRDIVVISKGKSSRNGDVVVATVDGEFTVKQLYKKLGRVKLKAANPTYPDIVPKDGQTVEVWGVVMGSIKLFRV